MNQTNELKKEDYIEPACPLCEEPYGVTPEVRPVPQRRIIEKMDEYMSRRDYTGAERHLKYWLEEAKLGQDLRGQLMIRNEMIGHYRKTGEKENAFANIEEALRLVSVMDFDGTISAGTTYTNAATAYHAFGEYEKAIALFEKAKPVYESSGNTRPDLLGGLYNNMALTYTALNRFPEAYDLYEKAYAVMGQLEGGVLEQAITCLNMADLTEAEYGPEEGEKRIYELVDKAYDLLNDPDVKRDGYYAFVCEKCAPSFSYYGYFMAADELKKRAEAIYERD
ncbi:MAG: tetratricopeptide repeat protein [Solobacterium sp.]|nr:tetratricopeptide repeat protein [Solobacterium sp.]